MVLSFRTTPRQATDGHSKRRGTAIIKQTTDDAPNDPSDIRRIERNGRSSEIEAQSGPKEPPYNTLNPELGTLGADDNKTFRSS